MTEKFAGVGLFMMWKYDPPVHIAGEVELETDNDDPPVTTLVETPARADDEDEGDPLELDPVAFRTFVPGEGDDPGMPPIRIPGGNYYNRKWRKAML